MSKNGESVALQPVGAGEWNGKPAASSEGLTLRAMANAFTLEVAAYLAIGLAALLLRIVNLDARPLTPGEAQTAAAAWEFLNGQPVGAYASPLLFTLNWVTFLLFGAFDLTARLLPAAFSTLLVLVPLMARGTLGRTGAVAAALLIAFSPTLVFFARALPGAELAAGAALSAVMLAWNYWSTKGKRALYGAAFLAGISVTADAVAFTILLIGVIYLAIRQLISRADGNAEESESEPPSAPLQSPFVRAALIFAAAYILSATTFLLNRDGLGTAFNLLGAWFGAFATIGTVTAPMNWLLVYEPLTLIFGLAGLVLAVTTREGAKESVGLLWLVSILAVAALVVYSLAGVKSPEVMVAVALPLTLLAGWFIGNLAARAREDITAGTGEMGGWRSTLAGEIPIFVMLMILAALIYLQLVTFLQQTHFSPALDSIYQAIAPAGPEVSLLAAGLTLGVISFLLLAVFVALSVLLIGAARTTTLLALAIMVILTLGTLRSLWLLNYSNGEPVRELVASAQTPVQMRDLVEDLEFYSLARYGDSHVIQLVADPALGAAGRWYLRVFPNRSWSTQPTVQESAQAIVTASGGPPPGDWMGQRYRTGVIWEPEGFEGLGMWKWLVFREGGSEAWQSAMLWLPTESE